MPKINSNREKTKLSVHGKSWWCCDRWFGSSNVKCPACGAKPIYWKVSEIRKFKEFFEIL